MLMNLFKILSIRKLLFISFFLTLFIFQSFWDPDYYWQLKTGEYIVTSHTLPRADIFSYTCAGHPLILHEWLFEVCLYLIFSWLGPFGVKLLAAALLVSAFFVVFLMADKILKNLALSTLISVACYFPFLLGRAPRPQLVTYLMFSIFLYILFDFKYFRSNRLLFLLPLLMIPWVNAHGGCIAGLFLLFLFILCEWLRYWAGLSRDVDQRSRLSKITIAGILTLAASSINPDFVSRWLYPFKVLSMKATLMISEWQSPDFHLLIYKYYLFLVFALFILYILRSGKPDLTEIVVPVSIISASFVSIRNIPLASLALIPFLAVAIAPGLNEELREEWSRSKLRNLISRRPGRGRQLGDTEYIFNWMLLIIFCVCLYFIYPTYKKMYMEQINKMIPVKATNFIIEKNISGRMFNTYRFGGYLIYRLYPGQKVFIDGRADVYGDKFFNEYNKIALGAPGWEKAFDKYKIDYVVCDRNQPIRQLLLTRGDFRLVFDDGDNSVLVKDEPKFAALASITR